MERHGPVRGCGRHRQALGIVSNELTEAERAVAETLRPFLRGPSEQWLTECATEASQAVVAAVRPIIEADALRPARALHARPQYTDSWGVRLCQECSVSAYYQEWPCPTAIALGLAEHENH